MADEEIVFDLRPPNGDILIWDDAEQRWRFIYVEEIEPDNTRE